MGWSFRCDTSYKRANLIEDLKDPKSLSPGYTMLKHRIVGNHHWYLYSTPEGKKTIGLNLMAGGGRGTEKMGWGYKGISESMGPCEVDCPLSLLAEADEPEGYAIAWRQKVREHHAAQKQRATACKEGAKVRCNNQTFTLQKSLGRKGWQVLAEQGGVFRMSNRLLSKVVYL